MRTAVLMCLLVALVLPIVSSFDFRAKKYISKGAKRYISKEADAKRYISKEAKRYISKEPEEKRYISKAQRSFIPRRPGPKRDHHHEEPTHSLEVETTEVWDDDGNTANEVSSEEFDTDSKRHIQRRADDEYWDDAEYDSDDGLFSKRHIQKKKEEPGFGKRFYQPMAESDDEGEMYWEKRHQFHDDEDAEKRHIQKKHIQKKHVQKKHIQKKHVQKKHVQKKHVQ